MNQDLVALGYEVRPSKSKPGLYRWWLDLGGDGVSVPPWECSLPFPSIEKAWTDVRTNNNLMKITTLPDGGHVQFVKINDRSETHWVEDTVTLALTSQPAQAQPFTADGAMKVYWRMVELGYKGHSITNGLPIQKSAPSRALIGELMGADPEFKAYDDMSEAEKQAFDRRQGISAGDRATKGLAC